MQCRGKFVSDTISSDNNSQLLSTEVITIDNNKSKDNTADPQTKGLTRELVPKSLKGIRLKPKTKVDTKET